MPRFWKIEKETGGGFRATVFTSAERIDWIGAWHSSRPEAVAWVAKHLEFAPPDRPTTAEIDHARGAILPDPLEEAEQFLADAEREYEKGRLRYEFVEDAAARVAELTEETRRRA